VLIGLDDDNGYWIVPAPITDVQTPGGFQFSTRMAFSPATPTGTHNLVLRGVDRNGIGPAQKFVLTVAPAVPAGSLVFTLVWDTNADLDLHVVVPNPYPKPDGSPGDPIEIWSKAAVGVPRGQGIPRPTADQIAAAGYLDRDSNAGCVIDGARQEDVIFPATATPPSGEYIVRVDAFSMCGQSAAQWEVMVNDANGAVVNPATWEATDADTRGDHIAGSGRLALDFNYPTN
jgi:hypothetical protein